MASLASMAAATMLLASCGRPLAFLPGPSLPPNVRATLPLLDPFTVDRLAVNVRVAGADGTPLEEVFTVDSGASVTVIREPLARRLRLSPRSNGQLVLIDAVGETQELRSVTVPEVQLGTLSLRDLNAAAIGPENIVGQDLLGQLPWEVDLDRATLTLGAAPWPAGTAIADLPLQPVPDPNGNASGAANVSFGQELAVAMDGRPVMMTLDTGAWRSALPEALAKALGLSVEDGPGELVGSVGMVRHQASLVSVDLAMGGIRLDRSRLMVLTGRHADRGLLGLDLLRRFVFRVEPGRRLQLRERRDEPSAAAARIARWPWSPHCGSGTCVSARLEGNGAQTAIVMSLAATYQASPTSFLWRCATPPPAGERAAARSSGGAVPGIVVYVPTAVAGLELRLIPRGTGWPESLGADCAELTLVDVDPAGAAVASIGPVALLTSVRP